MTDNIFVAKEWKINSNVAISASAWSLSAAQSMTATIEQPLVEGGVTHVKILWRPWHLYDLFQEVDAFVMWKCWCGIFLFHVRLHPAKENTHWDGKRTFSPKVNTPLFKTTLSFHSAQPTWFLISSLLQKYSALVILNFLTKKDTQVF